MYDHTPFSTPSYIHVNGITLEVFEAGKEHAGNPIVLCHGWPDHAFTWRHLMTALARSGYHVIAPNQRGYGGSSCPSAVTDYDIAHLTADLVALLDHYGYERATFVGHDWGSFVVWSLAQLYPDRVHQLINLSVPYLARGEEPWIKVMSEMLGPDFYMVHFNQQPGVADAVFDAHTAQFLRNLYRKNVPPTPPAPGMAFIELAKQPQPQGEPLMSEEELDVLISAFSSSGFTGGINWYRNLDCNWHLLGHTEPLIEKPALMIYGERDTVARAPDLERFVPEVDIVTFDCGHWIHLEMPEQTNQLILDWLVRHNEV